MTAVINTNLMASRSTAERNRKGLVLACRNSALSVTAHFALQEHVENKTFLYPPFQRSSPPLPNPLPDGERAYCDTLSLEGYDCVNAGGKATQEAKAEGLGEGEKR